jgi:hypothetical protein
MMPTVLSMRASLHSEFRNDTWTMLLLGFAGNCFMGIAGTQSQH